MFLFVREYAKQSFASGLESERFLYHTM